ncbi:exosortase family protein XrtF [uncultured Nonlabens sp.]|uniref:exosortase family protein XrtF n=1 Tax=uncultured Nonlabens sp. TaxID=859306 RepID=UPI0030DCAEA5
MKALKPYYPVFKFVGIFAMLYILFSIGYYFFISMEWGQQLYPDPITAQVSYQTQELLRLMGYEAQTLNSPELPSVMMFINEVKVYRVIEGCNAVSLMILFTSFVVAFARGWKKTLSFLIIGIVFIYIVNLIRLVVLGIVYYDYSDYAEFSHEIIFPGVIYGAVVLLWIFWIRNVKPEEVE